MCSKEIALPNSGQGLEHRTLYINNIIVHIKDMGTSQKQACEMITERDPGTNWQQIVRVITPKSRTPRVYKLLHSALFHVIVPLPIPLEV